MSEVKVIAVIKSAPGFEEKIKTELVKLVEPTRKEQGCLEYDMYQDDTDSSTYVFLEKWQSSQCLENHLQSQHLKEYLQASEGMMQELKVYRLNKIC